MADPWPWPGGLEHRTMYVYIYTVYTRIYIYISHTCVCVFVCVYHLNRCKTSHWFSLICRGTQHFTGTATSEMGYPAWPAGRTCIFSLQFWLTWHAAKPRTAQLYFHFTVVAIWNQFWLFTINSAASEPSSVFSPKPCRRQYSWFSGLFRRNHVADVFGLLRRNHVADIYFWWWSWTWKSFRRTSIIRRMHR